jgi:hypothetical protein
MHTNLLVLAGFEGALGISHSKGVLVAHPRTHNPVLQHSRKHYIDLVGHEKAYTEREVPMYTLTQF